jgi:hypothetical protein
MAFAMQGKERDDGLGGRPIVAAATRRDGTETASETA